MRMVTSHGSPSNVRSHMKPRTDLSLWNIVERLQRRLEQQGMTPASVDRAVSLALRQFATVPGHAATK